MKRRWSQADLTLLTANADASRGQLLVLFPHRSWKAITMTLTRCGIRRRGNAGTARSPRPTRLLQDLTAARLMRRLPLKAVEGRIGHGLRAVEPGANTCSVQVLQKWCDALDLELRALPKGDAA